MKSKSQKKLLINNKSFDGLFEKEKNKNVEELIEKSRVQKKERLKYYEDLFKKEDEEFKLLR